MRKKVEFIAWLFIIVAVIGYAVAVYPVFGAPDCPNGGDCHPRYTSTPDPLRYKLLLPIVENDSCGWLPCDLFGASRGK